MPQSIATARGQFSARTYGDPTKPPLMLVHGWPQSSYCWHHMTPFLKDFYVIAPDLRGMGYSNRELDPKFYEKDQMAEDLFAVADALGINTFYLGGHDWGGAIVQEMTLLKPERIRKLLILNMIIINNAIGQQKALKTQMRYQFRTSWYQNFMSIKGGFPEAMIEGKEELWIRFFSRGISNPIPEDAIQEYIRCYKIPGTLTTAGHIYRSIPKDRKRWKEYESIVVQVPTKIIHGILDPVVISDYLEGIQTCYADVSITELEGGHFICDEQPEAVGKAMTDFLNQGH